MALFFIYKPYILGQAVKPATEMLKQNKTERNETKLGNASELTGESFELSPRSNCSSAIVSVCGGVEDYDHGASLWDMPLKLEHQKHELSQ